MNRPRILVVEDERTLAQTLLYNLERDNYEVHLAYDGAEGLRRAQGLLPDLVILDLMLPGMDGLEVCRLLRADESTKHIPILMLTARAEESDQLIGFSLGADDYVTKPFSVKVLLSRVRALQRRNEPNSDSANIIEHLHLRIDRVRHQAYLANVPLDLTPTEFRLLESMLRQPGRAFSRAQIMAAAIGDGQIVSERTIDVHIKTLRKKLGSSALIQTIRGIGYRFAETMPAADAVEEED
jgi:two-component system phosphate regulon response regulator PhoB